MKDPRETFIEGIMALSYAMRACNLHPEDMTVVVSEKDGKSLEHLLTGEEFLVISGAFDPRYSTAKADHHMREFKIAGVTVQYRTRPYLLPSGNVV